MGWHDYLGLIASAIVALAICVYVYDLAANYTLILF